MRVNGEPSFVDDGLMLRESLHEYIDPLNGLLQVSSRVVEVEHPELDVPPSLNVLWLSRLSMEDDELYLIIMCCFGQVWERFLAHVAIDTGDSDRVRHLLFDGRAETQSVT